MLLPAGRLGCAEPEKKSAGPQLVETESVKAPATQVSPDAEEDLAGEMPPLPSAEEMREQASAYEASAQRVEDLMRARIPLWEPSRPSSLSTSCSSFTSLR